LLGRGEIKKLKSVKRKIQIQIGIMMILFSLSACESIETENGIVISTEEIETYSEGFYVFKGTIVSIGDEAITDHGFCWSESENPDIECTIIQFGSRNSTGNFSYTGFNFSCSTTYFVRAFATAGLMTYYGDERSFTTPDTLPLIITDIENNIYGTIKIGNQIWMASNLKVTRWPDGTLIPRVEEQADWYEFSLYTQAYCWYENYAATGTIHGALYTWPAAMYIMGEDEIGSGDIQGVCPDGWHLPDDSEWKELEMYLGMNGTEVELEKWRGTDEGGKLKHGGTQYWKSPNSGSTDESCFCALPSGWRDGAGYFKNLGTATRFWSSSIRGDYAWVRQLDYNSSQIYRGTKGLYEGLSVRCVKDER
jgi:uncharacterized protein (TIGR02145 family)